MSDRAGGLAGQVRLLFDAKAATWPQKYAPDGRLAGRLTRFAAAVGYHITAGGHVLDLGCGTGELARHMGAARLRVTGCDISAEMLARAAAGDPDGAVEWVELNPSWRSLPFGSATFDAVVAASVLEYVEEPVTVLRECARVLRTGGIVLLTVPDLNHPVRWLEWLAGRAARVRLVRAAGRRCARLDGYLTYLRISRQRRSARWWRSAAAQAGLRTVPQPKGVVEHSPLRLFVFQRPDGRQRADRMGEN